MLSCAVFGAVCCRVLFFIVVVVCFACGCVLVFLGGCSWLLCCLVFAVCFCLLPIGVARCCALLLAADVCLLLFAVVR